MQTQKQTQFKLEDMIADTLISINDTIERHELDDRQLEFILLIRTELITYMNEFRYRTFH